MCVTLFWSHSPRWSPAPPVCEHIPGVSPLNRYPYTVLAPVVSALAAAVARTWPMYNWREISINGKPNLRLTKCFTVDDARWSSGLLEIYPGCQKERQSTRLNYLVSMGGGFLAAQR